MNLSRQLKALSERLVSVLARLGRTLLVATAWFGLGVAWLWAALCIWFFDPWPTWLGLFAVTLFLAATLWCGFRLTRWAAWRTIAVGILSIWLIWSFQSPSNDRTWMADQTRTPFTTFDGNVVTIENVRHATYRSCEDYDVRWHRRQYDLDAIETVDFVVEPFAAWRGLAHTLLTFGFADGRHVAISIEIRKEVGEIYTPLKGLFRQYELMYVVGDERDLIGLRANVRKNPVHLYPIRATKDQVRALFVAMLERGNQLAVRPEFYNTLTNTCTTNIVWHFENLTDQDLPIDVRVLLPGYSDALAMELGLIDFPGTLEQARQLFRVPMCAIDESDDEAWSRQIR